MELTFEQFDQYLNDHPRLHAVTYCQEPGPHQFKAWPRHKFKPGKAKTVFFESKQYRKPILEVHFTTTKELAGLAEDKSYFLL